MYGVCASVKFFRFCPKCSMGGNMVCGWLVVVSSYPGLNPLVVYVYKALVRVCGMCL